MIISYDYKTKKWAQSVSHSCLYFGKNNEKVEYLEKPLPHCLLFQLENKKQQVGPLIGILTSKIDDKSFTGNVPLFKSIQKSLYALNKGISVVFTPHDVTSNEVNGFIYDQTKNQWLKIRTPLPDIVYNRIPYRDKEQTEEFTNIKTFFQQMGILFFNPFFFTKWDVYTILHSHSFLKPFLPDTRLICSSEDIKQMLSEYQKVYIKKVDGHQGEGIAMIEQQNDQSIKFSNLEKNITFHTLNEFWNIYFKHPSNSTIIQQAIESDTFQGKRYDLRIFVHLLNGIYTISGIGVRQSGKQSITTHVPNGGKLLPFKAIRERINLSLIQEIVQKCGEVLSKTYGFIGEFTIDMGLSQDKNYFIYEVNSKPMSFDEPDIREKGLANLITLFFELANFH